MVQRIEREGLVLCVPVTLCMVMYALQLPNIAFIFQKLTFAAAVHESGKLCYAYQGTAQTIITSFKMVVLAADTRVLDL